MKKKKMVKGRHIVWHCRSTFDILRGFRYHTIQPEKNQTPIYRKKITIQKKKQQYTISSQCWICDVFLHCDIFFYDFSYYSNLVTLDSFIPSPPRMLEMRLYNYNITSFCSRLLSGNFRTLEIGFRNPAFSITERQAKPAALPARDHQFPYNLPAPISHLNV